MFRYGGPIKEGVMHGIREPKKNGGSMNRQAALVGNPNFPMQDGRALHSEAATRSALEKIKQAISATAGSPKNVVKSLNPAKKIGMAKNAGLALLNPIKNFYKNYRSKLDMPPKFKSAGGEFKGAGTAGGGSLPMSLLERAKYFATKNPKTTAGGLYLGSGPAYDIASGSVAPAKTFGRQLMDLAVPDFIYDQDAADAEKAAAIELAKKQERDALRKLNSGSDEVITETVEEKTPEQLRKDRIEKYRDIVDIKGMNKDAAYNSLIAASQAVLGDGDFKGSIKDGSLINKIIGSTSKAFDKPKATKDAIDTLILKGEIEADIAAGKAGSYEKQVAAVAKNLGVDIKTAQKMLIKEPVDVRSQVVSDISTTKQPLTHKLLVSSVKKQIPGATVLLNTDQAKDKLGENQSAEDYLMTTDIFNTVEDPSGVYIIGQEVVQVDKKGNTTTLFP
jgi:hypothetical protein